jgi:hypothetical protein
MNTERTTLLAVVLAAALPLAVSAETAPMPHGHGSMMQSDDKAPMSETCQAMMARHQEMQEQTQAMDAELDRLTAAMSAAHGKAKVRATAAVVEKLVEQRKAMGAMMMHRQPMMMTMMGKKMGQMVGDEGTSGCPMMQEMMKQMMEDEAEGQGTPPSGHSEHHPD